MDGKLNRSEMFSLSVLLLYGSFSSTKYALLMGNYALPFTALGILFEFSALCIATLLPTIRSRAVGFLLSLFPLCAVSISVYDGARLLKDGDFGYIPFAMIILSSLLLCVYLATRNISSVGRVSVIILICTVILLVFLAAIYAKDFEFSNIFGDFSDKENAVTLIFSSLPELMLIYLAKSFFACEEKNRAAKPPLEMKLTKKEVQKQYFKMTALALLAAAALKSGVTAALLSLASPQLYKLSKNSAVFAARLLHGVNLSPLISLGIYILTLFSLSFALSLTVHFAKNMRKK